jgi:hypothetical protein
MIYTVLVPYYEHGHIQKHRRRNGGYDIGDVTTWDFYPHGDPRDLKYYTNKARELCSEFWPSIAEAVEKLALTWGHEQIQPCQELIIKLQTFKELLENSEWLSRWFGTVEFATPMPSKTWGGPPDVPPEDHVAYDGAVFVGVDGEPKQFFNGRAGRWEPMSRMALHRPIIPGVNYPKEKG